MGIKERKAREKQSVRALILDTAMEMVQKHGLCHLTMRNLATQIEYSPSMIYEYFENKELIHQALCSQICSDLLKALKKVPPTKNPEDYLLHLIRANVDFLRKKPQGIELLTLVCFGTDEALVPKEFLSCIALFSDALQRCNCKGLQTKKALNEALDVIRSLHVGMITLSKFQTSTEGLKRIGDSLTNGVMSLLKAWKLEPK